MIPRPMLDFMNPDYPAILRWRMDRLRELRAAPEKWAILKAYYRQDPAAMIDDWGCTMDPRLIERGLFPLVPFVLFPKQREFIAWTMERWRASESGLCEKSRDLGASWCAISLSCVLCLTHDYMAIGFGSRKEEYVDKLDSPKALFYKARVFMRNLPRELRGGWREDKHAPFLRIKFPQTESVITGEAGDSIGRGDRTALYFVDEAAHLERPALADASLSATTNCRIDISSPRGRNNPFAFKRFSWPERRIFTMHWRDDPRKDDAWYRRQEEQVPDPIVRAQEIDLSYDASVRGVVIPAEWVRAAIDAHIVLGIPVTGARLGALDVADEGPDLNCYTARHGILTNLCHTFSGEGSDLYKTTEKALTLAHEEGHVRVRYDADGLGVGLRGDARVLKEQPENADWTMEVGPFKGSGSPVNKEDPIETGSDDPDERDRQQRTNDDYFRNAKAQGWWALRWRFWRTYSSVVHGRPVRDPDQLISLSSKMSELDKLVAELSQPTYKENEAGKIVIEKTPQKPGQPKMRSPNRADSLMILYAPIERGGSSFFDLDFGNVEIT